MSLNIASNFIEFTIHYIPDVKEMIYLCFVKLTFFALPWYTSTHKEMPRENVPYFLASFLSIVTC